MAYDTLDTNLIIRILERDIPSQYEKIFNFLETSPKTHILNDLCLSEVVYVLETYYEEPRQQLVDRITFFLARFDDKIKYNYDLTREVLPFYLSHPKLSFVDCCLAYYAKSKNATPLMTLDHKLASQVDIAKELS